MESRTAHHGQQFFIAYKIDFSEKLKSFLYSL